jgi:hypothetical protein
LLHKKPREDAEMSDLIDSPGQGENAPEFSVSELSSVLKRMIEGEFSNVRIRGEVGTCFTASFRPSIF